MNSSLSSKPISWTQYLYFAIVYISHLTSFAERLIWYTLMKLVEQTECSSALPC